LSEHHVRTGTFARLLGTASLATLAGVIAAHAQPAAPVAAAPVEEVLITGSLIHGAPAVGVPVTSLGEEAFHEAGAITVSDMLRTVPGIVIEPTTHASSGGGSINRAASFDIHGMNSSTAPRSLMLIDGKRFPAQAHGADRYDPSIIPQLAVDHIDVLVDGASATYGSDAIAGVLNVILKRGYDGATSQARYGRAQGGGRKLEFSTVYGRVWDGGDLTLTYEWSDEANLPASERLAQFTINYTPWGLDDTTQISSSIPAVVSLANVGSAQRQIPLCSVCFSLPTGIGWNYGDSPAHTDPAARTSATSGIPTTSWAAILARPGALNEVNPFLFADANGAQRRNAAALTFDQMLVKDLFGMVQNVELAVEGFYSNRRVHAFYPVLVNPVRNTAFLNLIVPTTNPYYPSGAPAGLRVSYNFSAEMRPYIHGSEISDRYSAGFNFDTIADWKGALFFASNEEKNRAIGEGTPNTNNVLAALGNTVASVAGAPGRPGTTAFTKPAGVPFLNVFCDPYVYTCNSPATLAYLNAYRDYDAKYALTEFGANFDGPLFMLPAGPVRAAVGGSYTDQDYIFYTRLTFSTASANTLDVSTDIQGYNVWAAYAQVNVPIVGDANMLPFVRRLEVEGAYRYDKYSNIKDPTTNPKISANWMPVQDLMLRASWGTSFRAPSFGDTSSGAGFQIQGLNAASAPTIANTLPLCLTGETAPPPGSASAVILSQLPGAPTTCAGAQTAINALYGPGVYPYIPGVQIRGGSGGAQLVRGPASIGPEEAETYSFGFAYDPTNFLSGLHLDVSYFDVTVENTLQALEASSTANALRDPNLRFTFILKDDPNFNADVAALLRDTHSQVPLTSEGILLFISDGAVRNAGSQRTNGIDFAARYDLDWGNVGAFNTGIDGTYYTNRKLVSVTGSPPAHAYDAAWTDPLGNSYASGQTFGCPTCTPPIPPRFKYRARVGWALDGFSAVLFMNYQSHYFHNQVFPPPVLANPAAFPNYSNLEPNYVTFDLSLGYNTGDSLANVYLNNIDIRLVGQNIFDKPPLMMYKVASGGSNPGAFDVSLSPVGRFISLGITKTW
jgi:iron complex outermembrane receptor protein